MSIDNDLLKTTKPGYEQAYVELFGEVPGSVRKRWSTVEPLGRGQVAALLEELRSQVLLQSALGLKAQQLVQFGQLVVLGKEHAATLHARAALRAGATRSDLLAVAETALITVGVAGYTLGIEIIAALETSNV
jgi:4-carboxymuconolactone decarboxylase